MAKMGPKPKAKAKKSVSPVVAIVVIIVVLAMIVVVYVKFGKEKTGLDENDPQIKQMRADMQKMGGLKGIKKRMEEMRSGKGRRRQRAVSDDEPKQAAPSGAARGR